MELGWGGLLFAAAVLLFRRVPAALLLRPFLGPLRSTKDILFLGWFGPVGAAALYYATHALRETGIQEVWTVGSLAIVASIVVHGITDTPLTKLYGRRAGSASRDGKG